MTPGADSEKEYMKALVGDPRRRATSLEPRALTDDKPGRNWAAVQGLTRLHCRICFDTPPEKAHAKEQERKAFLKIVASALIESRCRMDCDCRWPLAYRAAASPRIFSYQTFLGRSFACERARYGSR